jgi:hypothetical protein
MRTSSSRSRRWGLVTPEQWAEVLEAGFHAARGKDEVLAAALYAMARKAGEIANRQ